MKIVVSGGAGFIGSQVADAYLERGHQVLIVDDLSTGVLANVNPRATLLKADLRSPEAAAAVEAFAPELLNLHAAQIDVRRSVAQPAFDADVNIGGALNLLEAARRAGTLRRVVYAASGGSMYGDTSVVPTPEAEPARPVSQYGVSKHAVELYLSCYRALYGLHYVALRYANVYGPRQNPHGEAGVVAIFAERMLKGQDCTIHGDGGQTRDFVFSGDVVAANVAALDTAHCGGVNIGTGVETDVNQIYALLAKHVGTPRPAIHGPGKPGEQRRSVLDNRLARQVLGWTPTHDVDRGIGATIAWYRSRG